MKGSAITGCLPAVVTAASVFLSGCDTGSQQSRTRPPAAPEQSVASQVTPEHSVPSSAGIAFAVVLDCSASMNDAVSSGQKMDIARRASCNIVRQAESFSKTKDTPVNLAVYKFSDGPERIWPANKPAATPNAAQAIAAITQINGRGGTAIGDAVIAATRDMNLSGFTSVHILVVTDGENTSGTSPTAVASEFAKLPPRYRPNVYIVAFDLNATVFNDLKANGWRVLSASDGDELSAVLDGLVGGEILLEK